MTRRGLIAQKLDNDPAAPAAGGFDDMADAHRAGGDPLNGVVSCGALVGADADYCANFSHIEVNAGFDAAGACAEWRASDQKLS
jgi:hypothetical protein